MWYGTLPLQLLVLHGDIDPAVLCASITHWQTTARLNLQIMGQSLQEIFRQRYSISKFCTSSYQSERTGPLTRSDKPGTCNSETDDMSVVQRLLLQTPSPLTIPTCQANSGREPDSPVANVRSQFSERYSLSFGNVLSYY